MTQTKLPKDGQYHHLGGGTQLLGTPGHRPQFMSDDHWQRADGAEILAVCTVAAHWDMPRTLACADDLRWRKGIGAYVTIRAGASDAVRAAAHDRMRRAQQR